MKKWDKVYITVEIQSSPVALRYLGVMIWENHIRELWEYFKLCKMTLNRAFMGWYWGCGKWPQIERMHQCLLTPTQRIYLVWNSFMILSFFFYVAVSVFSAFNPGYSRGAEILWWENYNRRINMLLCYVV